MAQFNDCHCCNDARSLVQKKMISFPCSPSCDLSSKGLLQGCCQHRSYFRDFWSLAVPPIPHILFRATMMVWSHWLCHWFLGIGFIYTLERTYSSSPCGLAVLHYIGLKNIWVDSEVGLLHAHFSLVRLTRFHQDLGWLSCLRSPTFRHMYNLWSVFHRTSRPVLFSDL